MAEKKDNKPLPFHSFHSKSSQNLSTKPKKILKPIFRSEDDEFSLPVRRPPSSKPIPMKMQVLITPKEWIEPSSPLLIPEEVPILNIPSTSIEEDKQSVEMDIDLPPPPRSISPIPDESYFQFSSCSPMDIPMYYEECPDIPLIQSIFKRKRSRSPRIEVKVPTIPIQVKRQVVDQDSEDDMFAKTPIDEAVQEADPILRAQADELEDTEGYFLPQLGEILLDFSLTKRYKIIAVMGKGVFSNVVRAVDIDSDSPVASTLAIKIIRNNEATLRSGYKEIKIMQTLQSADPDDRMHCLRYLSSFTYQGHLCICFENLEMNLREVLRKYGDGIGLSIAGVREYGRQLLRALRLLKDMKILHCDFKPDNILVYEHLRKVKLGDFGSAMFEDERQITDNLVPRFYRAPEIILGASYDYGIDMWSFGCTMFEIYTGQILFPGRTNSEMLKLFIELKGPIHKRIRNRGKFTFQYFDNNFFYYSIPDSSGVFIHYSTPISDLKKIGDISVLLSPSSQLSANPLPLAECSELNSLHNFLELSLTLDSHDRITPEEALNHAFFQS